MLEVWPALPGNFPKSKTDGRTGLIPARHNPLDGDGQVSLAAKPATGIDQPQRYWTQAIAIGHR